MWLGCSRARIAPGALINSSGYRSFRDLPSRFSPPLARFSRRVSLFLRLTVGVSSSWWRMALINSSGERAPSEIEFCSRIRLALGVSLHRPILETLAKPPIFFRDNAEQRVYERREGFPTSTPWVISSATWFRLRRVIWKNGDRAS